MNVSHKRYWPLPDNSVTKLHWFGGSFDMADAHDEYSLGKDWSLCCANSVPIKPSQVVRRTNCSSSPPFNVCAGGLAYGSPLVLLTV